MSMIQYEGASEAFRCIAFAQLLFLLHFERVYMKWL